MTTCGDCAQCQGSEDATTLLVPKIADRLRQPCPNCGHRLRAHEDGIARALVPGVQISYEPPPEGSPLAQSLADHERVLRGQMSEEEARAAMRRRMRE